MKFGRGIVGVVAGIALWSTLVRMLETALISAIAGAPVASAEAFASIGGAPLVVLARLLYTGVVAMMAGYVVARIASHDALRHAVVAAIFAGLILVVGFARGLGSPAPWWADGLLVVDSVVGFTIGGALRAAAATAAAKQADQVGGHA